MTILSKPTQVREALQATKSTDAKLSAPVLVATAVVSTGQAINAPQGSLVITVPKEYATKAYERFLAHPTGHTVVNRKTGEQTKEHYAFGCMIDLKAAGFNGFFLGMPKSDE